MYRVLGVVGVLDDPVWTQVAPIEDFHQYEPIDQGEPSERTLVYLTYDEDNFYVAARMWDSEPDQIRARQLAQGGSARWDDGFGIYLDPFNNKRTGYMFQTNPNGVRTEGTFETPTRLNRDWEDIWYVEARINDEGWIVEMAIPFKTLNFDPDNPDWGFTLERQIARKQESISWSSYNRRVNPGSAGLLSGFVGLQQGRGLDLVPSIVTARSEDFTDGATSSEIEPALDVFYNFTPSLTGVLTLNTDFSATEADDQRVNLTRFGLFFPEKRDFFLQDVDIFSFGVTAYELFAFTSPWPGTVATAKKAMEHDKPPIPITDVCSEIDPKLADAIHACLSANPGDRPNTMNEFIRQLT